MEKRLNSVIQQVPSKHEMFRTMDSTFYCSLFCLISILIVLVHTPNQQSLHFNSSTHQFIIACVININVRKCTRVMGPIFCFV
jgi:hypothetical protein